MALGALPSYSAGDLERIAAERLTARFPDRLPIPVDIDYLVESEPGVTLDVMRGLRDGHGVAGAVLGHPDEDRVTVLIDEAVADGAAPFHRFTVAEEFGHVVLHRAVVRRIRTLDEVVQLHQSSAYYDTLDRNAKRFAAAVLMPPEPLRRHARALVEQLRQQGLAASMVMGRLTVRLAQRYVVSPATMRHRLTEWPVRIFDGI